MSICGGPDFWKGHWSDRLEDNHGLGIVHHGLRTQLKREEDDAPQGDAGDKGTVTEI